MGMIQNKVKVSQPVSHIIIENAGGLQGPAGAQGPEGPAGPAGADGKDGADGAASTIEVGSTTTLPAGSSAAVTNSGTSSAAVFNFSIPKGDKGDKGDAGAGLVITGSVATYADLPNDLGPEDAGKAYFVEADGKLYVWSGTQFPADGEGSQFEGPQGPAGQDGAAATVTVGSTSTLPAGSSATVTNSGTTSAAVLNFGIPAGATGATGATGPANTLSIGTVQGGDTAAATITGTAPNQTLNLTLPKGDQGDPGPEPELFRNVKGTNIELTDAGSSIKSLNYIYGDTEQETVSGKNLANYNTSGINNFNIGDVESGKTYTISFNLLGSITGDGGLSLKYGSAGTSIYTWWQPVAGHKKYTFTATTSATVYYNAWGTGASAGSSNIMLEEGSEESQFEPYVGGVPSPNPLYPQLIQTVTGEQTITIADGEGNENTCIINLADIELCKIGTYQDYIYKDNGNWYIHKELSKWVINSIDNEWYADASGGFTRFYRYRTGIVVSSSRLTDGLMSDKFTPNTANGYYNTFYVNGNIIFYAWQGGPTTLAQFGTYVSSNPITAYYPLATPTDTQITDATLISQLNALNSATLYNGNTYIQVTSTDLPGELDLDYWTYFHRNVETVDIEDGAVTTPKIADGAITPAKMDYPEFDNKTIWFNEATVSNTVGSYTQTTIDSKQVTFKAGRYFIFVPFSVNRTAGTSTELALNITFTGTGLYASNLGGRVPAISGYSFTARSGILIVPSDQTITVNYTYGAQSAGGAFTTTQFYAALIRIANS